MLKLVSTAKKSYKGGAGAKQSALYLMLIQRCVLNAERSFILIVSTKKDISVQVACRRLYSSEFYFSVCGRKFPTQFLKVISL